MPRAPAGQQYTDEKPTDRMSIQIYTLASQNPEASVSPPAPFDLYEDDGVSTRYESGAFTTISFQWDPHSHSLKIGARQGGGFPGMHESRVFDLAFIGASAQ